MKARPPLWGQVLEAADGDPLRAKEIFQNIDERWWRYWRAWMEEKGRAAEYLANRKG